MPQKSGRGVGRRGRVAAPNTRDVPGARARELIHQGVDDLHREQAGPAQRKFRQALGLCEASADARGYLALTHALLHQWDKAVAEAQTALQAELEHLVSLVALARAHFGAGRSVEANHAAIRALRRFYGANGGDGRSPHELAMVVDMLVFMNADRRMSQLYRRRVRGRPGRWDPMLLASFGIASFNCGHWRDARWAWLRAGTETAEHTQLFAAYLFVNDMVEKGRIPAFRLDYRLQAHASYGDDEVDTPGFVKVFALHTLWHGEGEAARQAALELLTNAGDEWSTALLLALVRAEDAPEDVKLHAGTLLMDMGLIPEDDSLDLDTDVAWHPLPMQTETAESDLDEQTAAFFGEALEADARGHGTTAEAGYRAVLDAVPNFVPALLGLATICEGGGRLSEAESLLRRALQLKPSHPLIRLKLAALHARQERFDEAWDALRTLRPAELPPGIRSVYYWLYGRLALMLDTAETAEAVFQRGLQEDPDNDELLAGFLTARRVASEVRQRLARRSSRRRARYEAQPITRDVAWVDALRRLTVSRLRAVARHIGLVGTSGLRKQELAASVAETLRNELATVWHALSPREQAALRWLDARGGWAPYDELRRRFGDDREDSIDWHDLEPETVPMRLQFHGLVFVGRLEGRAEPVAVIPDEARQRLKFAGRRTT